MTARQQPTDRQTDRVAVIGASMIQFGQRAGRILEPLAEAGIACLEDADVDDEAIDHLYVSNMTSGEFEGMTGVMNALVHDLDATPAIRSASNINSHSGKLLWTPVSITSIRTRSVL